MSLQDNKVFISPHNQKITCLNTQVWSKISFGTNATSPLQLVEAVLSQQDHKMPHHAWDEGGSIDNQVWQQAISALHNQDENCCSWITDLSSFNKNMKGMGIWYSAVVGDHLWSLFKHECTRNDCLEMSGPPVRGPTITRNGVPGPVRVANSSESIAHRL
ncbi:hypothetical protein BDM02DRAFT_3190680 [Thelephora ganbajun]|uniref:Uncharacterized protein n=1 Tax=Thelephora ganbajun TaxID=370292 RepID=A0ACB6Z4R1_THEGA|nr:hypothetical protein BDM02DRAFT_3190680 [Thelephora ganbajun]